MGLSEQISGTKGFALENLNSYRTALCTYNHAIQLNPHSAIAHSNKGIALNGLGRTADAEQAFQKARELSFKG